MQPRGYSCPLQGQLLFLAVLEGVGMCGGTCNWVVMGHSNCKPKTEIKVHPASPWTGPASILQLPSGPRSPATQCKAAKRQILHRQVTEKF